VEDLIFTFLFSISPFGEARVGIPYGILRGVNPYLAFLIGLSANLLVFPILIYLLDKFSVRLWRYKPYKKQSVKIIRRAKSGVGKQIHKYGFWGLMIFVMIPLPVTGAYMGTIAANVFKINRKKAMLAISLGLAVSCFLVAFGTQVSKMGIALF
jgi:uncharacterized membrane protein